MSTIRDVARLAGVSIATVSRVINGNGYLSKEAEKKVRDSMKMLNYSPNSLARGLASKKTNTIAMIVPNIANPFYPELAKAVVNTAKELGYTVFLGNTDRQGWQEKEYFQTLKKRYVDGIIYVTLQLDSSEITELTREGIPIVLLDSTAEGLTSILINDYQGAVMAMDHLLSIGCNTIAHISGPHYVKSAADRLKAYMDTMKRRNAYDPSLVSQGDFSIESGLNQARLLLDKNPHIDGIFAGNDLMAIGCLKYLLRTGIRVPDQVALIGFDGIYMTQAMEPEISTIAQPIYEMGDLAVRQLIRLMKDAPQEQIELGVQLVQRATTMRKQTVTD